MRKSNTTFSPRIPTDIFFKDAPQKPASLAPRGIAIEVVPTEPIFEKCSHLREKGGVLTQIGLTGNRLSRTVHVLLDVFIHCGRFHGQWARSCRALLRVLARVRVCLAAAVCDR